MLETYKHNRINRTYSDLLILEYLNRIFYIIVNRQVIIVIKLKPLIMSILIPLAVGGLAALLTMGQMDIYQTLTRPPLSPPSILFPIVWSILYLLMGISSYFIYISDSPIKGSALSVYAVQLAVNFIWPILFFNLQNYLLSFIWLVLLWVLVLLMIILFCKIKPLAGILQIPYLVWITFAGYLNLAIYFLNK